MLSITCKRVCFFCVWNTFYFSTLPLLAQTTTTGSVPSSNNWTPANWIALVTAIGSIIVAVIGAQKGAAAQTATELNSTRLNDHDARINVATTAGSSAQSKADANEQRLNGVGNRLDAHGQQITNLAQNQLPPSLLPQMQGPSKTSDH